jgi:hypothetical protein
VCEAQSLDHGMDGRRAGVKGAHNCGAGPNRNPQVYRRSAKRILVTSWRKRIVCPSADGQPDQRPVGLTSCSAIPLDPALLFCGARGQRAVRPAGVPHAVRMIAVFVSTAKLQRRADAGDRPATMMLAQVEESDRFGDGFPGQIDGLGRCR